MINDSLAVALQETKLTARRLATLDNARKNQILSEIVNDLRQEQDSILSANRQDESDARTLVNQGKISPTLLQRLLLDDKKYADILKYPETVSQLRDPNAVCSYAMELDNGLELRRISCPIGVIATIFESRPEVVVQISSLAIKSGNGVILKGGSETKHTNAALFSVINRVLARHGLAEVVRLMKNRDDVDRILREVNSVDLIVPRGSGEFVKYIQENTAIPVMGHAEGICHVYLDANADFEMAHRIVIDAKLDYPSVCNAAETLLIHASLKETLLPTVSRALRDLDCEIRADQESLGILKRHNIESQPAVEADWHTEYGDKIVSIALVSSIEDACEHINAYGSGHTDAIVTDNKDAACYFETRVDSATVVTNASTRFADGFVFGLGAEVGISTGKFHARGPVGLEGLMTYKYILRGAGQVKSAYGAGNRTFTHKPIPIDAYILAQKV